LKALDQISLGAPLPFGKMTSASVSFINLVEADNTRSSILAASLTQQLPWSASLYATAFVNVEPRNGVGFFAGLSIPFGDITVSTNASGGAGAGASIGLDAQKTLQAQDGSYGWRVHDQEGATPFRTADASYRSGYGTADVGVQQQTGSVAGTAQIDGSVAAMGGGIFVGERIHDSFAVVDAGAPGVTVLQDNRPIGVTNPWGKLLVPDLRSYQANKIAIDPSGLPGSAEADATQKLVVPANHAGVYVDFGVKKDVRGAIVILAAPDGKFLAPGSKGKLDGSDETFVVGYDGRAYIKHLNASNTIAADNGEKECRASFDFTPVAGKRLVIGPVTCQ
jgi:outer membrane usher protein